MPRYQLGDREFLTKSAAHAAFRAVLARTEDGQNLAGDDDELVRLLIHDGNHPHIADKVGPGIAAVVVRRSTYGTRGFWIIRTDGTEVDFSYLTALSGAPSREKTAKAALRQEVGWQIAAFRDRHALSEGSADCGLCSEPVTADSVHVDHDDPTFDQLATRFAESVGGWDQLAVECFGDVGRRLRDRSLAAAWQSLHETTARLRLTHRRCNLTRPRKES